jgi:hypothetical protein
MPVALKESEDIPVTHRHLENQCIKQMRATLLQNRTFLMINQVVKMMIKIPNLGLISQASISGLIDQS